MKPMTASSQAEHIIHSSVYASIAGITHPSWILRTYVSVMILFWTRSLRYSTEVPWTNCGLTVPPKVVVPEIVSDWMSDSLFRGIETVDVLPLRAVAKDIPGADDTVPVVIETVEELLELDLKEERRFWAEDFLRMVGRAGCSTAKWDIMNGVLLPD